MTVAVGSGGSLLLYGGAMALFGALFLAIAAVTLPGVRRRRLARELAADAPETSTRSQMSALGTKAAEFAERGLAKHDREQVLANALERAGVDMRAPEFVLTVIVAALVAATIGALLGGWIIILAAVAATIGGFWTAIVVKAGRRRKAFEEQLPDALGLIAGGLRAGHSLPQALDALVQESESPTCDEFRRALFETQLGHTLPTALRAVATRIRSEDFDWVVQAIEIQREVGGDLAGVLDNVTRTIRDRNRVRRTIDALTAEGRLSAVVLFLLPLLMFVFMAVVNPAYIQELTGTFAGNLLLAVGGGLMVVGGFWLRRIVRLVY
jgi:tight adherence protein B